MIIEIKCAVNVVCVSHPAPQSWEIVFFFFPLNQSLMPKKVGTTGLTGSPEGYLTLCNVVLKV